jgi:hypothetical protein
MITCNGGYCVFKIQGGSMPECKYAGYCDYQCPKDSRYTKVTHCVATEWKVPTDETAVGSK